MEIMPKTFKAELTLEEVYIIRKGLHCLKSRVESKEEIWSKGYLKKVNNLLADTEEYR